MSGDLETQELKVFAQIVKLKNVPWLIFIVKINGCIALVFKE